jgi:hypothetical protein
MSDLEEDHTSRFGGLFRVVKVQFGVFYWDQCPSSFSIEWEREYVESDTTA